MATKSKAVAAESASSDDGAKQKGRYRKIDVRIWSDKKFRDLSDAGKLVFFMLLTHPHMTAIGAMRASIAGLAEELCWETEVFRKAFAELLQKGMANHDPRACFISLPNFLKYNQPESPNVVKAWAKALDVLPECDLKTRAIADAKAFAEALPEAFGKALPEVFAKAYEKGMPNQEQEQEQEQKISSLSGAAASNSQQQNPGHDDRLDLDGLSDYHTENWQPNADRLAQVLRMAGAKPLPAGVMTSLLVKFNLKMSGRALTENQRYSALLGWIQRERVSQDQRPAAAAQATIGGIAAADFAKGVADSYVTVWKKTDVPPVTQAVISRVIALCEAYPVAVNQGWWDEYFKACREDDFLTGRQPTPLRGYFVADFMYLLGDGCFTRIVDRNQDFAE